MMRAIIRAFIAGLFLGAASAAACPIGNYPFTLADGTIADATQVMANFNQVTTGTATNCAASGNNNDITSLGALTTPITPAQGGSNVFNGTVGGTANAVTLSTSANFLLNIGNRVAGFVGVTNTGAATLAVNATGVVPFFRKTNIGIQPMSGGELIAGNPFLAVYNGTDWILEGEVQLVGSMTDWMAGVTAPPGWLIADGSSFVCANSQALCAVIGTTFGGSPSNPNLPDTRGRIMTGLDNYATAAGAANRLTSVATGCGTAFTSVGVTCANANQSHVQIIAELAQHNHTDSGHTHTFSVFNNTGVNAAATSSTGVTNEGTVTTSSGTANIQNTGSSQAMPIVNPNFGVVKIIKQ